MQRARDELKKYKNCDLVLALHHLHRVPHRPLCILFNNLLNVWLEIANILELFK